MSNADTSAPPVALRGAHRSGFWTVAFAFLIVMAFATLPSPLYGLYRTRDNLSAFTITIVYAIWAGGTIATLLAEQRIVARIGHSDRLPHRAAGPLRSEGVGGPGPDHGHLGERGRPRDRSAHWRLPCAVGGLTADSALSRLRCAGSSHPDRSGQRT